MPSFLASCANATTVLYLSKSLLRPVMVNSAFKPSFSRTPSPSVSFQPAASKIFLASSTLLSSNLILLLHGTWELTPYAGSPKPFKAFFIISFLSIPIFKAWRIAKSDVTLLPIFSPFSLVSLMVGRLIAKLSIVFKTKTFIPLTLVRDDSPLISIKSTWPDFAAARAVSSSIFKILTRLNLDLVP